MVHGRLAERLVKYEVGVFRHTDSVEVPVDGNRADVTAGFGTIAGRVTLAPVRDEEDGTTRDLAFGVAFARNTMPEGLYSVTGRALDGERFFDRMYVNGERTRLGFESLWSVGRFTLKGELLQLVDERKQQAVTGEDLSNLIVRGAYVTGVWRVVGEPGKKGTAVDVRRRQRQIRSSRVLEREHDGRSVHQSSCRSRRAALAACLDGRRHVDRQSVGPRAGQRRA